MLLKENNQVGKILLKLKKKRQKEKIGNENKEKKRGLNKIMNTKFLIIKK